MQRNARVLYLIVGNRKDVFFYLLNVFLISNILSAIKL